MKRFFAVILMLCILSCSSACSPEAAGNEPSSSATSSSTKPIQPSSLCTVSISCGKAENLLELTVSKDWELKNSSEGITVSRQGVRIGKISRGGGAFPTDCFDKTDIKLKNLSVTHASYREGVETRLKIVYSYSEPSGIFRSIEIDLLASEVSSSLLSRMVDFAKFKRVRSDANFGMLRLTSSNPRVLIIGNSFVGTSDIKSNINNLCGGKITADAISIGYGEVHTFASNVGCMSAISSGNYDVIFLCGLYSEGENITALGTILDACEDVGADLVLFPAHNENRSAINMALSTYPELYILDWKAEIDALISAGADYDAFCINDYHKHSTPLAGYVGANMIYRAICGELPTYEMNGRCLSKESMRMLGDYLTTGSVSLYTPSGTVYYL